MVKGHRWFYIERVSKKEKEGKKERGKKGERKGKERGKKAKERNCSCLGCGVLWSEMEAENGKCKRGK